MAIVLCSLSSSIVFLKASFLDFVVHSSSLPSERFWTVGGEGKVEPNNPLQHSFQRHLMDGSLNSFIRDINQNGRNEEIYREFDSPDQDFRRRFGLPLPKISILSNIDLIFHFYWHDFGQCNRKALSKVKTMIRRRIRTTK